MSGEARRVRVGGVELAYLEWPGERGPVVCLHDLIGHKGAFRALAARLSPTYRVLAVDLRGRGDSDKPSAGYGFAYHLRDLEGLADALGLTRFTLVGHSFGATVSAYVAALRPARVQALVLLDGGVEPRGETLRGFLPAVRRLSQVYPSLEAYLEAARRVPHHRPWTRTMEAYLAEGMTTLPEGGVRAKACAPCIEEDLEVHFAYNMWFHLPHLRCPTLFLRPRQGLLGDRGHVYRPEEAERLVAAIPAARYQVIEEGNHFTMVIHDEPPVLPAMQTFLEEVVPGAVEEVAS